MYSAAVVVDRPVPISEVFTICVAGLQQTFGVCRSVAVVLDSTYMSMTAVIGSQCVLRSELAYIISLSFDAVFRRLQDDRIHIQSKAIVQ